MPDFNLALASPEASDRLAAVRELKNSLIGSRTRKTLFIQVRSQLQKISIDATTGVASYAGGLKGVAGLTLRVASGGGDLDIGDRASHWGSGFLN